MFFLQGTQLKMSSSYHPQMEGQSEVLNFYLEMYLRCFIMDHPQSWLDFLPGAKFSYNTAFHSAINMPPFKDLYGRGPPSLL